MDRLPATYLPGETTCRSIFDFQGRQNLCQNMAFGGIETVVCPSMGDFEFCVLRRDRQDQLRFIVNLLLLTAPKQTEQPIRQGATQ